MDAIIIGNALPLGTTKFTGQIVKFEAAQGPQAAFELHLYVLQVVRHLFGGIA